MRVWSPWLRLSLRRVQHQHGPTAFSKDPWLSPSCLRLVCLAQLHLARERRGIGMEFDEHGSIVDIPYEHQL